MPFKCERCGRRRAWQKYGDCPDCVNIPTCDRCGADVDHKDPEWARLCKRCVVEFRAELVADVLMGDDEEDPWDAMVSMMDRAAAGALAKKVDQEIMGEQRRHRKSTK